MQHQLKPGFHIVVSVVSVVSVERKKFIGQLQIYGNLPYKCSMQKKRQIQLFVRDRMNSICAMNFFRTRDTTDTTIWKPGFSKIEKNCCSGCCCCYSVPPLRIRQISRSYFLKQNLEIFLAMLISEVCCF